MIAHRSTGGVSDKCDTYATRLLSFYLLLVIGRINESQPHWLCYIKHNENHREQRVVSHYSFFQTEKETGTIERGLNYHARHSNFLLKQPLLPFPQSRIENWAIIRELKNTNIIYAISITMESSSGLQNHLPQLHRNLELAADRSSLPRMLFPHFLLYQGLVAVTPGVKFTRGRRVQKRR